jgi:hypothetical protein
VGFQKMAQDYPPRLWTLEGRPESGKSTFSAQMRAPILVVDADHRYVEVLSLATGDVYRLSESPADNVNPDAIAQLLEANMPGANVATIVVDSLTAIISPLVAQAMADKDAGRVKSLAAAFRTKALAMRQLQDTVTKWGCDVLWIYHVDRARDAQANQVLRSSISETELARLTRSINLKLRIVQQGGRRGVKVAWARRGRAGMTLWDENGSWAGMPERIEEAVYGPGGEYPVGRDGSGQETPRVFPDPEAAIDWGVEQGVFKAPQHARNAYEKLKREKQPKDAYEMAALWVADVQARLAESPGTAKTADVPPGEPAADRVPLPMPGDDELPAWVYEVRRNVDTHPGASDPQSPGAISGLLRNWGGKYGDSETRALIKTVFGVEPEEITRAMYRWLTDQPDPKRLMAELGLLDGKGDKR